jgi:hypothetical protein
MAKCVYYPNVVNLASYSGSTSTLKIPCLGAKAIILTARATAGAQTVGTTVMTGFGMVQADAGFAGAAGTTHSDQIGGKNVTLNGAISIISPTAPHAYIPWGFIQIGFNAPSGAITNFVVDAFVLYEGERDKLDLRQETAIAA